MLIYLCFVITYVLFVYMKVFHLEVFARGGIYGLFKKLGRGGHHVLWVCEAQIPRGAHRIQEGANAPLPRPLNETMYNIVVNELRRSLSANLQQPNLHQKSVFF